MSTWKAWKNDLVDEWVELLEAGDPPVQLHFHGFVNDDPDRTFTFIYPRSIADEMTRELGPVISDEMFMRTLATGVPDILCGDYISRGVILIRLRTYFPWAEAYLVRRDPSTLHVQTMVVDPVTSQDVESGAYEFRLH